jgi:hypothetical protein
MNIRPFLPLMMVLCVSGQVWLPARLWGKEIAPRFAPCCVEEAPSNAPEVLALFDKSGAQEKGLQPDRSVDSLLFKPLLLSAAWTVGMGALAYWSKDRADRAYRSYMSSANAQSQKRYFDRAQRSDRLAGASFIGMEVGIVLTSYLAFFRR